MTIAFPVDNVTDAPVHVAEKEGFFKAHGVNVKVKFVPGSSVADAALTSGSVQFTGVSTTAFVLARSKNLPLLSVALLLRGAATQLIVSKKWATAHHLAAGQPLDQLLNGLKGATLAFSPGATDKAYFDWMVQKAGIPESSYHSVTMQGASEMAAGLGQGADDAFIASPPFSYQVESQGSGTVLLDSAVPPWNNMAFFLLVTTSDYAKAHPGTVRAVASALAEADKFIQSHPNQTLAVEQAHFPKLSADILRKSLAAIPFSPDGQQTAGQWNSAVDILAQTKQIGSNAAQTEGQAWTNQYIQTAGGS